MSSSVHRIVLLGPPAAGKGTQGLLLSQRWSVAMTSTGELLRREQNLGTQLGLEADRFASLGRLVPDEIVVASVSTWLDDELRDSPGFILDGTPRTLGQAVALDELLSNRGIPLTRVLLLDVPHNIIADRVDHRLVCERCGRSSRRSDNAAGVFPACSACGGALERRKDDTPEALVQRITEYEAKSSLLIPFYEARGLLARVSGVGPVEEVFLRAIKVLEENTSLAS